LQAVRRVQSEVPFADKDAGGCAALNGRKKAERSRAKGEDAGIAFEGEIRNAPDVNELVVAKALVIRIGVG
jgi:hypothetical protein